MIKYYLTPIVILIYWFSFSNELRKLDNSPNEFIESIGKTQIHLQQIPILYIDLLEGTKNDSEIKEEFLNVENHFQSLKEVIKLTGNKELKEELKIVSNSLKDFEALTKEMNYNSISKINKYQTIIQFQLNTIYKKLDAEFENMNNDIFLATLKTNILISNNQIINLKKYKFNQKMYENTQNPDYLVCNKDILFELNTAVDKLIINNTHNLSYDTKLANLITLLEQIQYNESHMKSIVDDTALIFESIRDGYLVTRKAIIERDKSEI